MLSHGSEASVEIFNSFTVSLLDHASNLLPLRGRARFEERVGWQ